MTQLAGVQELKLMKRRHMWDITSQELLRLDHEMLETPGLVSATNGHLTYSSETGARKIRDVECGICDELGLD